MKPVFLLVGSLAANAALVALFVARPGLAPSAVLGFFGSHPPPPVAAPPPPEAKAPARPAADAAPHAGLWSALERDDLRELIARLRAAGFPPAVVRAIIEARIEARFAGRFAELNRSLHDTPYWKPDMSAFSGNRKLFEDISQIYRERARLLRELLGPEAFASAGRDATTAQRAQFGNLAPAKIDLVQRIADDYAEMTGQIRAATQGIVLPEDREKIALLEREKRADLAAVLTPEELADYELRTSPTTMRLRTALSIMDAGEAEFRAIHAAVQPFAATLYPESTGLMYFNSDTMNLRRTATEQANAAVKAALGAERFAEYQRATNSEFQQLYRLGQRDGVPTDTLVRAFDVRATTAEASLRIDNDRTLSPTDKQTALKQLAQTARTQLLSTLGPATGPAYVEAARWVGYLEQGRVLTLLPDGNVSTRTISTPRPAPKG